MSVDEVLRLLPSHGQPSAHLLLLDRSLIRRQEMPVTLLACDLGVSGCSPPFQITDSALLRRIYTSSARGNRK
jgi:hypothetical protein